MATPEWDYEKEEQFEQADATQDDAWFTTHWSLYSNEMSEHVFDSLPYNQWKGFRKWLAKSDFSDECEEEQEEEKCHLLYMLDMSTRPDRLLEMQELYQELFASFNDDAAPSDDASPSSPTTMMDDLLSEPHLMQMMESLSCGQAPPAPVPLPQLGPGEEFEMTMQMIPDETTGKAAMSAKMIPTIVKKNGKKYRMNPDGSASSDEILLKSTSSSSSSSSS